MIRKSIHSTILTTSLALVAVVGCKSNTPSGTTPPEDTAGETGESGETGATGETGETGEATETAAKPAAVDCPGEVSDKPTSLWEGSVILRTPKNVELVEESPFFATTYSKPLSTCEAEVERMAAQVLEDQAGKDLREWRNELLESLGYAGGKEMSCDKETKNDLRCSIEVPASDKGAAANLYWVQMRKYDRVLVFLYQATPDQWPGVVESFKMSASRIVVPPPQ